MSYILNGTVIRSPMAFTEDNSTQVAQNRTLGGSINRDFFGTNKTVGSYDFVNAQTSEFSTINAIYQNYLTTGTTQSWQITEANYNGRFSSARNVHVDLLHRGYSVRGSSYLSDFTLILTEA